MYSRLVTSSSGIYAASNTLLTHYQILYSSHLLSHYLHWLCVTYSLSLPLSLSLPHSLSPSLSLSYLGLVSRVEVDSSVQQSAVHIRDHGPDIPTFTQKERGGVERWKKRREELSMNQARSPSKWQVSHSIRYKIFCFYKLSWIIWHMKKKKITSNLRG